MSPLHAACYHFGFHNDGIQRLNTIRAIIAYGANTEGLHFDPSLIEHAEKMCLVEKEREIEGIYFISCSLFSTFQIYLIISQENFLKSIFPPDKITAIFSEQKWNGCNASQKAPTKLGFLNHTTSV